MGLINYFRFNNKSSLEYNAVITGSGTFNTPAREVESVSVPGRNGDLHIDSGKFSNVLITYPASIVQDFKANFNALKAYLMAQTGYKRLDDTYDPDHYRRARFTGAIEPNMSPLNRAGDFSITFDCDPRRFLKSGEKEIDIISGMVLKNPTLYDALPLIRVYGSGTITINNISVAVIVTTQYTDLDCENQEAYEGATSCNSKITLTDGVFPVLTPGTNNITFSGFSEVKIIPHWWTT